MFGTTFGTAFGAPPPENHDQPKETKMPGHKIYRAVNASTIARTPNYEVDVGQLSKSGASEPIFVAVSEGMDNAAAQAALLKIASTVAAGL